MTSRQLLTFKNLNLFSLGHSQAGEAENPDFIGGKTGYLVEAKQTMASLFTINGKVMAVVVLKSKNHKTDTLQLVDQAKSSGKIN